MKKVFISVLPVVLIILCVCFGFVGCTDDDGTTDKIPEGTDVHTSLARTQQRVLPKK
ncbi:MAG: hypothetical protein K2O04_04980 [Clostridiales bacterium]|nr:hypothetical protein [Clostridiales bacterium]